MLALFDSRNNPITLAAKIGAGGEGAVYHVQGHAHLVAKIYHQAVPQARAEKLRHMTWQRTSALVKHSAWPVDLLYSAPNHNHLVGLTMAKISAGKPIHQLYSPRSRRQDFPHADWRFLIHAATNIARAFASVHDHGHVIGDVNHGNIIVDRNGLVRLIDCDSFQIAGGGKVFLCEVGVPEYTPPELHGQPLDKTTRTPNHDYFGLAVLIFQLLLMGRHPFSGTFVGAGDMPLERAIKEYRYAYGAAAEARHMRPPPNTLALSDISPTIATLFDRAFGSGRLVPSRPTSNEWIDALTQLSQNLRECAANNTHFYLNTLNACPWCQLEGRGLSLFGAITPVAPPEIFNLNAIWNIISAIKPPAPQITPSYVQLIPDAQLTRARLQHIGQRVLIFIALLSTFSFDALLLWWSQIVLALIVTVVALIGIWRMWSDGGPTPAAWYADYTRAHKAYVRLTTQWQRDANIDKFTQRLKEAEHAKDQYAALLHQREQRMQTLRGQLRERQLFYFLNSYRIENLQLDGISTTRRTALVSADIHTAADVTAEAIGHATGFGEQLTNKLLAWRGDLEASFRFDPNRGVDPRDISALDYDIGQQQQPLQHILESAPKDLLTLKASIEQAQARLLPGIESSAQTLTALSESKRGSDLSGKW